MAKPIYSRRLFQGQAVIGVENKVYVPAGKQWIVRCVDAYASVGLTENGALNIVADPEHNTFIYMEWLAEERSSKNWQGRQVVHYQDGLGSLIVQNWGDHPLDVMISGYEMDDFAG